MTSAFNLREGGSRSLRSWSWIEKVLELDLRVYGSGVRATYDFNLEKITPLRRAKCNSEEIGKKQIYLFKG